MTPDQLYKKGYSDGVNGVASNASYAYDENYGVGYTDGRGDIAHGVKAEGTASPFIADDHDYIDPPAGYEYTGEHRTPQRGEIYLTKNGNTGVAKTPPKNERKRRMLKPNIPCVMLACKFELSHEGRCSDRQLR